MTINKFTQIREIEAVQFNGENYGEVLELLSHGLSADPANVALTDSGNYRMLKVANEAAIVYLTNGSTSESTRCYTASIEGPAERFFLKKNQYVVKVDGVVRPEAYPQAKFAAEFK